MVRSWQGLYRLFPDTMLVKYAVLLSLGSRFQFSLEILYALDCANCKSPDLVRKLPHHCQSHHDRRQYVSAAAELQLYKSLRCQLRLRQYGCRFTVAVIWMNSVLRPGSLAAPVCACKKLVTRSSSQYLQFNSLLLKTPGFQFFGCKKTKWTQRACLCQSSQLARSTIMLPVALPNSSLLPTLWESSKLVSLSSWQTKQLTLAMVAA